MCRVESVINDRQHNVPTIRPRLLLELEGAGDDAQEDATYHQRICMFESDLQSPSEESPKSRQGD